MPKQMVSVQYRSVDHAIQGMESASNGGAPADHAKCSQMQIICSQAFDA